MNSRGPSPDTRSPTAVHRSGTDRRRDRSPARAGRAPVPPGRRSAPHGSGERALSPSARCVRGRASRPRGTCLDRRGAAHAASSSASALDDRVRRRFTQLAADLLARQRRRGVEREDRPQPFRNLRQSIERSGERRHRKLEPGAAVRAQVGDHHPLLAEKRQRQFDQPARHPRSSGSGGSPTPACLRRTRRRCAPLSKARSAAPARRAAAPPRPRPGDQPISAR